MDDTTIVYNQPKQPQKKTTTKRTKKKKLTFSYNAPVTLTFVLLCALAMYINKNGILTLFKAPSCPGSDLSFNYKNVLDYFRLFLHIFAYDNWKHFFLNSIYLLLVGPVLEEKYGNRLVLLMIITVAFATGIINACFLPVSLFGTQGIVFMMILLSFCSATSDTKKIPFSFLAIFLLYIADEFLNIREDKTLLFSTLAQIAAGICGSLFGFFADPVKNKRHQK